MRTSKKVWEVKGEVEGVTWKPHGLFYSPQHQSLLVCDTSDNGRLVVINLRGGSVLQIIPLPNLGIPYSLSVHEGNIILQKNFNSGINIDVLTITWGKPQLP